jgi:hypothetical protein
MKSGMNVQCIAAAFKISRWPRLISCTCARNDAREAGWESKSQTGYTRDAELPAAGCEYDLVARFIQIEG